MQMNSNEKILYRYIYLRTYRTNLYLRVNDDKENTIYADSGTPIYSCIFEVINTEKDNTIFLKAYNNKFLSCRMDDKTKLCCKVEEAKGWETFEYNILDGERIQLKCLDNSKYICAENEGWEKVYCNRIQPLEWETFTFGTIKGVNLKGWIIPTEILNPEFFRDYDKRDLFSMCSYLGKDTAHSKLIHHYLNFIKKDDFLWMAYHGINSVRLPIAYWMVMEDKRSNTYPLIGYQYINDCFDWAEAYGISVSLDIQGAVGSQNGKPDSGKQGDADFDILESITFVKTICKLFSKKKNFLGINLLHEPDTKLIGQHYIHNILKSGVESNKNLFELEDETFKNLFNQYFMKNLMDLDRELFCEYLGRGVLTKYYKQAYENVIWYFPNIMITINNNECLHKIIESDNLVLDLHSKLFNEEDNKKSFQQLLDQVDQMIGQIISMKRKVILGEFSCTLPSKFYQETPSEIHKYTSELYKKQREAARYCFAYYFYTYKSENEILSLKHFVDKNYIEKF